MAAPESASATIEIKGRVDKLFFTSPTFTAGVLRPDSPDQREAHGPAIPFAGRFAVREGDFIIMRGRWVRHPKFGMQVDVNSFEFDLDLSREGLQRFLANNKKFHGIGPAKAQIIAEQFADNFEQTLFERPELIMFAAKVSKKVITTLQDEWKKNRTFNLVSARLSGWGLTQHQITKLIDKFGNSALTILESDPFVLIGLLSSFGFKRTDEIARKIGIPKDHPSRLRAGILATVSDRLSEGDCWIEYQDLVARATEILVLDTMDASEVVEKKLDDLIREGKLTAISHSERLLVADHEIHTMESDLSKRFTRSAGPNKHFTTDPDVAGRIVRLNPSLNALQREAVINAAVNNISLICGGAGVGKTYCIRTIVKLYEAANLTVQMAAPTGKAARRMEESVGKRAQTIHRLLEYSFEEGGFTRNRYCPLTADLIIIDEMSMVDSPLCWSLFDAIDFNRTALVMVGDHNQLPPVGPGNVLRDLINTRIIPTVELTEVVRQAGILKENSIAILRGSVAPTSETIPVPAGTPPVPRAWYLVDNYKEPAQIVELIAQFFGSVLSDNLGFDVVRDCQLLTPTHKGPLGTRDLNILLQRLIQKKYHGIEPAPVPAERRPSLYIHDKVIQTRNNDGLNVMNGTLGIVRDITKEHTYIDFEGETETTEIVNSTDDLGDVSLAYCLTIHKVQGSEFPCVVAIIHKSHAFQHHRNLVYTAVTRAKRTAIIVGDQWGIRNAVGKTQVDKRHTFLSLIEGHKTNNPNET